MAEAAKIKDGRPVDVLRKGDRIVIKEGGFAGEYAHVIDPVVIPDGEPHQRKIVILLEDEQFKTHILPRQVALAEEQKPQETTTMAAAALTTRPAASATEAITDPMDPALDAFRPDPAVVDDYIRRKMEGGYSDVELLLNWREVRDDNGYSPNIALVGDTQSGKTMLMQVLAVEAAKQDGLPKPYPLFTLNGSAGISNYDLFGKTTAVLQDDGQEKLVWMEGLVPLAARCGGFLYLDEWNAVPPSQAVALHGLLDDRRQFTNTHKPVALPNGSYMPEVVKAHPNFWVVSTINPIGYRGTQAMAEATANRFRWLDWGYDDKIEEELIPSDACRKLGMELRLAYDEKALRTPVGTTALLRLNQDTINFGADVAVWSFMGMFQLPADKAIVNELIERHGIKTRLSKEYDRVIAPKKKK